MALSLLRIKLKPSICFSPFRLYSKIADGSSLRLRQQFATCPKCKARMEHYAFKCPGCGGVGPVADTETRARINPYDLFNCSRGKPIDFSIDIKTLTAEYRQRMRDLHPDSIQAQGGDENDIEAAASHSAIYTKALNDLRDPVSRSLAILELVFGATALEEESTIEDQEFLLELLEASEAVVECIEMSFAEGNRLKQEWQCRMDEQLALIAEGFEALKNDKIQTLEETEARKALNQIQSALQKCRAIEKLLRAIVEKLPVT